ncbi:MAG TPA: VRR-NUC domain-containing protein [Geobacteraceae bacterium]
MRVLGPAELERVAENNNIAFAAKLGIENRKMNGMGKRSWPDRLFIGPNRVFFFIEYKVRGELPTPAQATLINKLRKMGHHVYVVDDKEVGRKIILYEFNHPGGPPMKGAGHGY